MATKTLSPDWSDYELIDAGGEKKLERWGKVITIRPERQAYFQSGIPFEKWYEMAHLEFVPRGKQSGTWKTIRALPHSNKDWTINYKNLTFLLAPTKFKHIGLFPEQATNWDVIQQFLQEGDKMLNLFAYTGAASIVGRSTGAEVTHVDAVKQLISWAKSNMEASHLDNIRWIHEDALKFAQRELKRGNQYHLIIMDPPAWGIGANKEKWKIEHKLEELIQTASQLLEDKGLLILNTYSPKVTLEDIEYYAKKYFDETDCSELWKNTSSGKELFYGHLLKGKKR